MKEYIELGPVPSGEHCAQVGDADFQSRASAECAAYADQLRRQFPNLEETGAKLRTKWSAHDFGAYPEVVIWYDAGNDAQVSAAWHVEGHLPETWDDLALKTLGIQRPVGVDK